jgi:hypothetical protein
MTETAPPRATLDASERRIAVAPGHEVSALLVMPAQPRALYVLAHGAGADMRHAFMHAIAQRLAGERIATLRYQFPYTERGRRRIDPEPLLLDTVRAAVATGRDVAGDLPLVAGGKSMGGPHDLARLRGRAARRRARARVPRLPAAPVRAGPASRGRSISRTSPCRCCSSRVRATRSPTSGCSGRCWPVSATARRFA